MGIENPFEQQPATPQTPDESKRVEDLEGSVEKERFLEKFIRLLDEGRAGFAFYGKIRGDFNVRGVDFSSQAGDYHGHSVGKFLTKHGVEDVASTISTPDTNDLLKQEVGSYGHKKDDDFLPDEMVVVGTPTKEIVRGTKTETRMVTKKGIFGTKTIPEPHEVPNKVREPLRLNELLENGSDEEAHIIAIIKNSFGADGAGRSYVNSYQFFVDGAMLREIFGTNGKESLLKKYPDLLIRVLGKLSPELLKADGFVSGKKRRVLVLEKNFWEGEPYAPAPQGETPNSFSEKRRRKIEVMRKIKSGEATDKILEYAV